jgi:hypothetical protein
MANRFSVPRIFSQLEKIRQNKYISQVKLLFNHFVFFPWLT